MGSFVATVRAVGENSPLRRVLVAYTLYDLVEFAVWVAIILYAYAEGGTSLAGLVAVVQVLPAAFIGPLLAGIGDRMPRGTALALAHGGVAVTASVTTVALLVSAPVAVVVACAATITIALAVVRPIHYASQPGLARSPEQLVSANALSAVAEGAAMFTGPVIAGFGVSVAGPALVLGGSAVAAVMATLLCLRLPLGPAVSSAAHGDSGWRAAFQGLASLSRDWAALVLLLVMTTRFFIGGAVDILGVTFNTEVLKAGDSGAGLIIGAIGIGAVVGGVVAGSTTMRRRLTPIVATGGAAQGIAFAAVALTALLAPAMIALAVCGLAASIMLISGRTLLQRSVDDRVLARVFAVQEGVALLGVSLGAAMAPLLVDRFGPANAFVPVGIGAVVLTLAGFMFIRRLDARAVFRPEEIALLRRIGFLSALPPYEIERLAGDAEWMDVTPGQEVIRQGDIGDRFYAIAEGSFTVVIDGERRPGYLGPGEGFGEMALLTSQPRNATITAVGAGRLLAVSGPDFLAAVTGGADGQALAEQVAAAHLERDRRHGG